MEAGMEVEELRGGTWDGFRKRRQVGRDAWWADVPPSPTWTKESYMEDQQFIMPLMEDSVVSIGELYNIRESRLVGSNLIHYNKLTPDHITAFPRKDLEYRFDYISDAMDLLDKLRVEASILVDFTMNQGAIKISVKGSALYESLVTRKFFEDEIQCTYRNETFSVQLQPSAIYGDKAILNNEVYEKLITNKLEATHVCTEVILGGESIISLYMKKDDQVDNRKIEGSLNVNIQIKQSFALEIDIMAQLNMDNNTKYNHIDDRIFVYSKPPFKVQPNSVPEMLKCIKDIPMNMSEERHFRMFKEPDFPEVTGVPIRYKLTPIERVIEVGPGVFTKSFRVIEPGLLNEFLIMMATLMDFQSKEFIKRKIYEREPRTLAMLKDLDNPITMKISERETELASQAKIIKTEADIVYQEYKKDKEATQPETLRAVIAMFNAKFDVVKIYQEIEQFRREAKKEIVGIHIIDADEDVSVTFLSNDIDMEDWYGSERRMKILLHTNTKENQSPAGTFLRLYNISSHLKTLGADVGVAYPSISQGFKLCVKTNAIESIYQVEDIPFALQILGMAVGRAENIPRLFWTVNGAMTGIRLPIEDNLSDIPSLIAINRELQDVKVCPTYMTLREEIAKKDGRVKIVLEVQALESIADSIVFFRKLRSELEKEPAIVPVDWVVGTFDLEKFHDAPIAFAFIDNQLFSVCLDNLDILILLEQLRSETPDFELLKAEKLRKYCMYPNRGNFGMQVAELLGQYHGSMTDQVEELASFARPESQMTVFDYLNKYEALLDTMFVNRELLSGDDLKVISAVAAICMRTYPQMVNNLKTMGWNEAGNTFQRGLLPSTWIGVAIYLKEFLEAENPLLAKADYLRRKFDDVAKSYETSDFTEDEIKNILESIKVIIDHENPSCPPELKEELLGYGKENAKPEMQLKGYAKALAAYCEKEFAKDEYFDLRHFMNFAALLKSSTPLGTSIPDTVGLYIQRVLNDPVLGKFPGADRKLKEYLDKKSFFQTLSLMSKIQYDHKLFMMHQCLYLLLDIDDTDNIKVMVNKMGKEEFTDENYEDLWKNKKFNYYMLKGVNSQSVLEAIAIYQCYTGVVPTHIPVEFEEKLIPMLLADDDLVFEWKEDWNIIDEALKVFQSIVVRKSIPKGFPEKLRENVAGNSELRSHFKEADVLYFYDEEMELFTQPWDIPTIARVVDKLMDYLRLLAQNADIEPLQQISEVPVPEEPHPGDLPIKDPWKIIAENVSPKLHLEEYNRLTSIITTPNVNYKELHKAMSRILPYVIQKGKLLSPDVLSPSKVFNYLTYPRKLDVSVPGVIDFSDISEETDKLPMVSRGDILTYLFNSSDPVVGNNAIQGLVKNQNPTHALPLVIQAIDSTTNGNQFILLYKQLKNIPIKWEAAPGEIVQNNLFANPFKLTVVVRLGENEAGLGKSQIVNSIMAPPQNCFASIKDSSSDILERPVSHPGYVELAWLTKETSKLTFWERLSNTFYSKLHASGSNEILLLANLHGDANDHYKISYELNQIGANFIVLLMPADWEVMKKRAMEFTSYLGTKDNVHFAFVDPIRGVVEDHRYSTASVITTREISDGKTTILEKLLVQAFNAPSIPFLDTKEHVFTGLQEIETIESRNLLLLIKKYSLRTVRQMLKLHTLEQYNKTEFSNTWNQNEDLRELIEGFLNILGRPAIEREGALSHVKQELAILSTSTSIKIRNQAVQLIEELKTAVNAEIPILDEIRNLHNQVKALRVWIDERTLGLEHFFREVGRWHEIGGFQGNLRYAPRYADHILKGNEIEIFNRDAGDIFWGQWMKDVLFENMPNPEEFLNSRIFVVSAIGLISSGKSTLLNALFGSKFSVSISGGTKGIFMKLLFLEDKLRDELKVDIIVLLDTQGISTIGGVGDEETLQKEQQLIALVVGLSNLTLLNSRGIQLGNMTNVLESIFAKLTSVEELIFVPDFLLVHHQTFHRHLQSEMAIADLTDALRLVSDATEKNELDVGARSRIGRRMDKIMQRVKYRDIVQQVRPLPTGPIPNEVNEKYNEFNLYHESIVHLYEKILEACKESDRIVTFGHWYELSSGLWSSLTCHKDNFPLRFTNSEAVQNYVTLQKRINSIKDLIDWAFLSHEEGLKNEIELIETDDLENLQEDEDKDLSPRERKRKFRLEQVWKALRKMAGTCERNLEKDGQPCQPCLEALQAKETLLAELKGSAFRFETQEKLNDYIVDVRMSIWNRLNQSLMSWEMNQPPEDEAEEDERKTLNVFYNKQIDKLEGENDPNTRIRQLVSPKIVVVPAETQIINEVAQYYRNLPHIATRLERHNGTLTDLSVVKAFDLGYYNAIKVFELEILEEEEEKENAEVVPEEGENPEGEVQGEGGNGGDEIDSVDCKANKEQTVYLTWAQKDWLEAQIKDVAELMWQSRCYDPVKRVAKWVYEVGMIRDFQSRVVKILDEFEERSREKLLPNFKWEAHYYGLVYFILYMRNKQNQWDATNLPLLQIRI